METKVAARMLKLTDWMLTVLILLGTLGLFAYGCYAIWDTNAVVSSSLPTEYQQYKPGEEKDSLEMLQKINPEVIGWIHVYQTGVDYPVVQAKDNEKYLKKNAKGEYSLAGSIFLDSQNDSSFQDFNSILYGHHMEYHTMFGDVSQFKKAEFFRKHRYGSLYCDGREWGLEFFAFLEVDAYDTQIYMPGITGKKEKEAYLKEISDTAIHMRNVDVTTKDRIVALSTCTTALTNGRHILVGKITDEVVKDSEKQRFFGVESYVEANEDISSMWVLVVTIGVVGIWIVGIKMKAARRRGNKK